MNFDMIKQARELKSKMDKAQKELGKPSSRLNRAKGL